MAFGLDSIDNPEKVHRRDITHRIKVGRRRLCRDERNYFVQSFTIKDDIFVDDFAPMWTVDRDYYFAKIRANVGLHNGDHPDDGTPSGTPIHLNVRVVSADLSTDSAVLDNDARLEIDVNKHFDADTVEEGHYNIKKLFTGESVYIRVSQVGSGRPGTHLVTSLTLVPVP